MVNTRTISRDTADQVLDNAVQYAAAAGERDKTRVRAHVIARGLEGGTLTRDKTKHTQHGGCPNTP